MTRRLASKQCFVTGAAAGSGGAIVQRFVAGGASLITVDVDLAGSEALADGLGRAAGAEFRTDRGSCL